MFKKKIYYKLTIPVKGKEPTVKEGYELATTEREAKDILRKRHMTCKFQYCTYMQLASKEQK